MAKIGISSSKIEASGKIGGRQTKGSINDKGAVELGIDFKVGGLGVTTDYGGGIKVSIAGQSITWGREGGNIKLNVGGFEVIVEARNCVVTETKKIAGMTVASHTYPDPGCKLPEKEKPSTSASRPPTSFNPKGLPTTKMCNYGNFELLESTWAGNPELSPGQSDLRDRIYTLEEYCKRVEKAQPLPSEFEPGDIQRANNYFGVGRWERHIWDSVDLLKKGAWYFVHTSFANTIIGSLGNLDYQRKVATLERTRFVYLYTAIGAATMIPGTHTRWDVRGYWFTSDWYDYRLKMIDCEPAPNCWSDLPTPPPRPFLPTGNKPPMNQDCCEEILDKLDDFEEILHVDFFKKNKFPVPAYLLAPGCDAQATVEIKNYYGLFRALFQAVAHGTIISPKIAIQDTDSVKEGDQSLNSEYLSATGWAEAITKMLYEVVDDGNVATNMDIRTGVTVTQLLVAVADLSHKVDTIIDVIGVTTVRKKDSVETSFSLVSETNSKGFDPKKDNQKIDLNDDRTTEQVLGDLLRTRKNPIVKEEIHPKSKTLVELLEALKNK